MTVANGIEAIDHIAQASEELNSGEVVRELGPFLEGPYLENMIAWEGVTQTLKAMRGIEAAISKVESPGDRTTLGVNAAGNLINVMRGLDEAELDTHDECAADLTDQASRYIEVIEDPEEQALKYGELAEGTARLTGVYATEQLKRSLGDRASLFLDDAVESAQRIKDPASRSSTLIKLAEVSTGLILSSSENAWAEEDPVLASHLRERPIKIYQEALEQAAFAVRRGDDSHHDKPRRLVLSMAESAAKVRDDSPELAEELIDMTASAVDEEVASYVLDGPASDAPVIEKAINLGILGSDLSRIIDKKYSLEDDSSASRQQLIEKMVELFKASQTYRQEVAQSSRYKDHIHDSINFSSPKLEAAERLLDSDPEVAKELIAMGFDFALTHDRGRVVDKDSASKYIEDVRQLAERRPTVSSAVELFSMAYQLGRRPHSSDSRMSNADDLKYTAFRLMWSLEDAPDESVAIEEIDRQLVDFTVKVAIKDGKAKKPTYPRNQIGHLQKLGEYVADPDLKQYISDQYEALKAKEIARQRPTSRIAAIAFDNWSRGMTSLT